MVLHSIFQGRILPVLINSIIVCILLSFHISSVSANVFYQNGTMIDPELLSETPESILTGVSGFYPIQFFYSHSCGSCRDAIDFLRSLTRKHPDIPVNFYNLGSGDESRLLYHEYKNRYGGVRISYPVVFIGDIAITGSGDIVRYLPLILKR